MNTIEERLWEYIDGTCSTEESKAIRLLIDCDALYRQKYEALRSFNSGLGDLELDEPSMGFTYGVMETIRKENASKPLKATVNKGIIGCIGLFFVLTISVLLVFTLSQIDWSAGRSISSAGLAVPHIPDHIKSTTVYAFLFIDLILALFLLDHYLRRKLKTASGKS